MNCRYCSQEVQQVKENQFYCSECDLQFVKEELISQQSDLLRKIELSHDLYFFEYVETKELLTCLTIELINYLGLARKAERHLKNKLYQKKLSLDEIDKQMVRRVRLTKRKIENILIERNGYYPRKVFQSAIEKELGQIQYIYRLFKVNS